MKVKLIAVGKIKEKQYKARIDDFLERISHYARFELVELKDSTPEMEGERIIEHLQKEQGHTIALTEEGRTFTSREFATHLEKIDAKLIFIVGGPFGLTQKVKSAAKELISLSPMTFTHEIARLLLVEQLYRAISIQKNLKYHKD